MPAGYSAHNIVTSIDDEQQILNQRSVLKAVGIKITASETNGVIYHLGFVSMVYPRKTEGNAPHPYGKCEQAYK
jgi:hypothetical protein